MSKPRDFMREAIECGIKAVENDKEDEEIASENNEEVDNTTDELIYVKAKKTYML